MFRRIGQGFCGTVWAAPTDGDDAHAIKREDGGPGRSLYNDYVMHQKVLSASQSRVCIPRCHQYVFGDDQTWWDTQISCFPQGFESCNVLITGRIPPFPTAVRDIIIDKYCPPSLQPSIRASEPDQDCLIRPYLGRRRRLIRKSRFQAFSLRNYPLHADQIEELALDNILYARIMAETLADLYWRAHIDANDVEFVLAPSRGGYSAEPSIIRSDVLGDHTVWILDFDCCTPMPFDETGVEQAVSAFFRNDPFYPRPGRDNTQDQLLWSEFKDRFLEVSEVILRASPKAHLPALWVDLAEQRR
ncbi:MAG: hypothetical protein M1836_002508 [Candelina mexicana]|nr:MAG: hypothetical protein M1836_002508 [Candelina mexicana]